MEKTQRDSNESGTNAKERGNKTERRIIVTKYPAIIMQTWKAKGIETVTKFSLFHDLLSLHGL